MKQTQETEPIEELNMITEIPTDSHAKQLVSELTSETPIKKWQALNVMPPPNTKEKAQTTRSSVSPQFRVQKRIFNKPEWKQYLNPSVPAKKSEGEYEELLAQRSE